MWRVPTRHAQRPRRTREFGIHMAVGTHGRVVLAVHRVRCGVVGRPAPYARPAAGWRSVVLGRDCFATTRSRSRRPVCRRSGSRALRPRSARPAWSRCGGREEQVLLGFLGHCGWCQDEQGEGDSDRGLELAQGSVPSGEHAVPSPRHRALGDPLSTRFAEQRGSVGDDPLTDVSGGGACQGQERGF